MKEMRSAGTTSNTSIPAVRTVLLVEDEPLVARALSHQLALYQFRVVVASTEDAIITSLQESRPDVVLMDIGLGGHFDGITMAEEILVCEDTPVVLISGGVDDDVRRRAERCGAYGLVSKPSSSDSLVATLRMAIQKHADLRKRTQEVRRLTEALDAIDTAMVVLRNGEVELMNRAAAQLTGTRLAEAKVRRPAWAEQIRARDAEEESSSGPRSLVVRSDATGTVTCRTRRFTMPNGETVVLMEREPN